MRVIVQRAVAEFIGTAGLLIGIIGSGVMAEQLSSDAAGIALLGNAIPTAAILSF